MDIVLDVDDLSVSFGGPAILESLRFQVTRGSTVAIIGPSGAGKTVLLRALMGSIPFTGTIRWAPGLQFGYVPQKLDLVRDAPISGADFLRAKASLNSHTTAATAGVLRSVGLSQRASMQPIGSLSRGQVRRLLVGSALMGTPDVLLLDEPTAGVDESGQERLNELVHRVQREHGLTVLFISHDLSVVSLRATRVLCLSLNRVCFGPPATILTPELINEIYGAPVAFHLHDC